MKNILFFLSILTLLISCIENKEIENNDNKNELDLTVISPSSLGIDTLDLQKITQKIEQQDYPNLHSVLIAKNGQLIYKEYFEGKDYSYGKDLGVIQYSDTTLHDIRSISKSIVATCVGIALQKGYLKATNQKIASFFPEYDSLFIGGKENWTIYDFLTMSTSLDWNEQMPYTNPENDELQLYHSKNPIEYILSKNLVDSSNWAFNYNGGATMILAKIVEHASNMPIDDFAKTYLFNPLNITQFEWMLYPGSNEIASPSGLRLSSIDLMKIALLYRNKGKWNEQQIISENWVKQTFEKQVSYPSSVYNGDDYYGYQLYIWDDVYKDHSFEMISASGNGDQKIYWNLKYDLIMVITAGNYNNSNVKNDSYALLQNEIFPLFIK